MLKNNVKKRMPKNADELKRFMVEEWDKGGGQKRYYVFETKI
jgi:hypothetical protein